MAEGKAKHDWGWASAVLAMLYNTSMNRKGPVKEARAFNPYLRETRREPDFKLDRKESMTLLKRLAQARAFEHGR